MGEYLTGLCSVGVDGGADCAVDLGRKDQGEEPVHKGGEVFGLSFGALERQ